MSYDPGRYLGRNPANYARSIHETCKLKTLPICERVIADSMGLSIRTVDDDMISRFTQSHSEAAELRTNLETASAFLLRDKGQVWVNGSMQRERIRMGVVHECGHHAMPWHSGVDYFCSESDLGLGARKTLEREAFGCGSFILMPSSMFIDDILSLEIGLDSIVRLAHRYSVSKEATSIHYARVHPGHCAVLLVEVNDRKGARHHTSSGQVAMAINVPTNSPKEPPAPLRVRYCSASHRFPKFIPAGTGIREGNIIFDSWNSNVPISGEVEASVFGSTDRIRFHAECSPVWNTRTVQVLLWTPDTQMNIRKEWILQ